MDKNFQKYWAKIKLRIYGELLLSILLRSTATVLLGLGIVFALRVTLPTEFLVLLAASSFLIFTIYSPLLKLLKETNLINLLHTIIPGWEYSLGIFFKPTLSNLEQVQREKLHKQTTKSESPSDLGELAHK